MIGLPHNFPQLRRRGSGNHRASVILLGAGMSVDVIPLAGNLLRDKRASAEAKLGFRSALPSEADPESARLYEWAEEVIQELVRRGDPCPKLTFAESLDIPTDPAWRGGTLSFRDTPRHRVVARFAREGLLAQIWSLNWDCVQETALENVGVRRDGREIGMPWPTVFRTVITAAECALSGESHSITVIKPHGCVISLGKARESLDRGDLAEALNQSTRFLVTESELSSLDPSICGFGIQQFLFATLSSKMTSNPFIAVGWKVSETYLTSYFESAIKPILLDPNREPPIAIDEVSIISRTFNREGQTKLASCYGKDDRTAHINVGRPGFDIDRLFLWIQALFAMDQLIALAPNDTRTGLEEIAKLVDEDHTNPSFLVVWIDSFLSVWVRLCWRCGMIRCRDADRNIIESARIPMEDRDEHIPWSLSGIERPEISAAARLLTAMHNSGNAGNWDYERFPGAFFRKGKLIVPLPHWGDGAKNDLRGLKPLVDSIKRNGPGFIETIGIVVVGDTETAPITSSDILVLKQLLARELSLSRFSTPTDIEDIPLNSLFQ